MARRKVLYVTHNHPSVRPGGAETYALELYEAMRRSEEFEPFLLSRTGPPLSRGRRSREGTLLSMIDAGDPNQYFFHTEIAEYDWFYSTSRNKSIYTRFYPDFLAAIQPDLVHFQHTLFFGYDILRQTRNLLPSAPIVYTLHEYLPICYNNGQMVRTFSREPCHAASPRRCHECFPDITPQQFFLRKRFIQSHLALVDLFLAPSRFLLQRYVDWGIPAERIRFEEYGRADLTFPSVPPGERPVRNRVGYFGQFNEFKGVNVLLEAVKLLASGNGTPSDASSLSAAPGTPGSDHGAPAADLHLWVHGANLEFQPEAFRNSFSQLLQETRDHVTLVGEYDQRRLPALMENVDWVVVPSIWWENSPLVIQEAFLHGRPVICSDIGGMAEKVADGVNGLHFRAGSATSLADTLRRAVTTPGLWERLRSGVPAVYGIDESAAVLAAVYRALLERSPVAGGAA
jgi:glycosyltransferase involved in cell wall biosynthesis